MAILKPSPSAPSRLRLGMAQPSKKSEQLPEARMPTLSSGLLRVKPLLSVGTRKAEMPLWRFALSVMAKTRMVSACGPLVMKFLEPLSTYSSPRATATVLVSAASEPLCGSVRA